jgi:hypothetical protein
VRLTLRTLLAYLDDTLEPAEIKQIGQKVAESDAAQELIARIKQVTRRRRLTTPPPAGPGGRFDPNTVAEYLDNELSGDALAELEKQCLESDVHLAEIAACHQILTLVLGEPALVPPTAKERMYGLVRGREAIPFRKAASPAAAGQAAGAGADHDADEMLLLGLPFYRRGNWLRWALPLAAVLLVAALGVALYQAMPGLNPRDPGKQVVNADKSDVSGKGKEPDGDAKKPDGDGKKPDGDSKKPDGDGKDPKGDGTGDGKKPEPPVDNGTKPTTPVSVRIAPPSKDRVEAGAYVSDPNTPPSILVQREAAAGEAWRRVRPGARVHTSDQLVSLPGFASEVRLDNGVWLLLRGHVREFTPPGESWMDFLLESACVLHAPAKGFDADLTLERGRLYLSNHKEKDPATVRLRFGKDGAEVWDLTLAEPGTEVGIDLLKHYTRDINYLDGEEPRAELYLVVLRGKASLKIDSYHYSNLQGPPGPALFAWDNKGAGARGPAPLEKVPGFWSKVPPDNKLARDMGVALKEMSNLMVGKKTPGETLEEMRQAEKPLFQRLLALYCCVGLDQVRRLIDALGEEGVAALPDRETAIFALRRWISRDAAQSNLLYDPKRKTGYLKATQKYRDKEAEIISQLLHDFDDEARKSPDTYELLANYLANRDYKEAIGELAYWHLRHLSGGARLPAFNAGAPAEERQKAADEIRKMIKDGKLPPAEGPPPMPPK